MGVSGKSIDKAAKIVEHAPELAEKVKQGQMELEPAYREARQIEKQKAALPVETPEKVNSHDGGKKNRAWMSSVNGAQPKMEVTVLNTMNIPPNPQTVIKDKERNSSLPFIGPEFSIRARTESIIIKFIGNVMAGV